MSKISEVKDKFKLAWASSQEAPKRRFATPEEARYVTSYLLLRFGVGCIGLALPFALHIADCALAGVCAPRDSLSAYYHSAAHDIFTGGLCAIGVVLIAYKAFEKNAENYVSMASGIAAVTVALVPTKHGDDSVPRFLKKNWAKSSQCTFTSSRLHFLLGHSRQ